MEARHPYKAGKIWLGRSQNPLPIGYGDDRHVCLVSGTRGGKGTSIIVNNLALWPGPAVVIDTKGENATVTAARRGPGSQWCVGMGQAVRVLDPYETAVIGDNLRGRFNPMDALDPEDPDVIDDAGEMADAIVVVREEKQDAFFDESARQMVKALILHVLTAPEFEGERNLVTVRKLLARGDWKAVDVLKSVGKSKAEIAPAQALLWDAVSDNEALDGVIADIGTGFASMRQNSPKTFESVLQSAHRNTEFIDSPDMKWLLETSDFRLSDLKTRREGMSLYLCLPQRRMNTHFRWLRLMITLIVNQMEKTAGQPACGHPVLLLLDEFSALGRMPVIENAMDRMAGYGVKMFLVLQSLGQLKDIYKDRWETFVGNCGLKIFFNNEDHFTREYAAKLIGDTETVRDTLSETDGTSATEGYSGSVSRGTSRNSSHGGSQSYSRTEGTSGSETYSESSSVGGSKGVTYAKALFGMAESGASKSESWSVTTSRSSQSGWSESETEGESTNWSEGTSSSEGVSFSRSRSNGYSRSRGRSEAIHRRALIAPDEIGRLFGTVRDKDDPRYPGLALVLMAGQQPAAVRRVNYYEDDYFLCCFDPHPDHKFRAPDFVQVTAREMAECAAFLNTGVLDTFRKDRAVDLPSASIERVLALPGVRSEEYQRMADVRVGDERFSLVAPGRGMIMNVVRPGSLDLDQPIFRIGYYPGPRYVNPREAYRTIVRKALWRRNAIIGWMKASAACFLPALFVAGRSVYRLSLPLSLPEIGCFLLAAGGFLSLITWGGLLGKCPRFILHGRDR
jgi:type IV secretory pathway TraG/TraD family ATPase VirD4